MQQLKSLFCFQGRDQAGRFGLISLASYLVFLLFTLLFNQVPIVHLMLSLPLVAVIGTTAKRRVLDAALTHYWAWSPMMMFVLCVAVIMLNPQGSGYFLLILAVIATLALMSRPSAQQHHYILGYCGPVDLSMLVTAQPLATHYANRIEPTLVAGQAHSLLMDESQRQVAVETHHKDGNNQRTPPAAKHHPIPGSASIQQWLQANKTLALGSAALLSCITFIVLIYSWLDTTPNHQASDDTTPTAVASDTTTKTRDHRLEMPNDYYLLMDENQGLLIHWPSYDDNNPVFWSILSGLGEQSCQQLVFNDSQAVRTNLVEIDNGGDYYASFSPLDTAMLINAIADKSRFSLCGFEFSLKGSRAAINRSAIYTDYLH